MTEEEKKMLRELHDFFMKPPGKGRPTRAEQIDDLLIAVRTGKLSFRAILWLAGASAVILGAAAQVKGFMR